MNEGLHTSDRSVLWFRRRSGPVLAIALLIPFSLRTVEPTAGSLPVQSQTPLTVAVLELTGEGLAPADAWLTSRISEAIEQGLFRTGAVRLVERRFLSQVMEEIALQLSGAVADETVVDVGRLSGAAVLVTGTVTTSPPGDIGVRLKVLDVATAEIRAIIEAETPRDRLADLEEELGARLTTALRVDAGRRRGDPTPPPPLPLRSAEALHRARLLVAAAPLPGLDPARSRRRADYMMALDLAERVLGEVPGLPSAQMIRGIALLNLDDPGRAIDAFEQAARDARADPRSQLWLASALGSIGEGDRAIAAAREGVALAPEDGTARSVLGYLLASRGEGDAAATAYLEALERSPDLTLAESGLRVLLTGPQAEERIRRLGVGDPSAAAAGRLYQAFWGDERTPDPDDVARVLEHRPRLFLGPYWAGLSAQRKREYADSESRLKAALVRYPDGPQVHRELGRTLLLARRCTEGARHVRLYIRTARTVDDIDELQRLIDGCREKRSP